MYKVVLIFNRDRVLLKKSVKHNERIIYDTSMRDSKPNHYDKFTILGLCFTISVITDKPIFYRKDVCMNYRMLGRSGVLVSPLCLGTMNFGGSTNEADSFAIMQKAVEGGINFFYTANVYNQGESERITGKFFKEKNFREQVLLATKVHGRVGDQPNEGGASRYHIIKACEDSLQRLQTDHIDLYQLHRSPLNHPQDETLRAFDDLIRAGKVRYVGCSTHPAWLVMEALSISERYGLNRYISEQPPYNLLDRRIENELVPLCQKYGLAILPWSPLAMGILAGRYA